MAFQPGEQIAQVLDLRDYVTDALPACWPPATAWSRRPGSSEYDTNRTGGLIAVNLREGDELVGAGLASAADDLLLVSRKGQSVRFHATDETLRPMGRATSGVTGMKFRDGDQLLSMSVVRERRGPRRVRGLRERPGQAHRPPRTTRSRGARPSASRWPRSPSAAATWSAR